MVEAVTRLVGAAPKNIQLYRLAFTHSSLGSHAQGKSMEGAFSHNERLEYLGDAILGAVVAEYLFKKYPLRDEGFLTEMRARIVNRESLSALAEKVGVSKLLEVNTKQKSLQMNKTLYGDAMEALVGAVYLDRGYNFSKKFIITKLIAPHYDLDSLGALQSNPKSKLLEWAQQNGRKVVFEIVEGEGSRDHSKVFIAKALVDGESKGLGRGNNKKKAEQAAAAEAILSLEIG